MYSKIAFKTKRTDVFYASDELAEEVQSYLIKNKERLAAFEPLRSTDYYELKQVKQRISDSIQDADSKKGVSLIVTTSASTQTLEQEKSRQVIAIINFSNFIHGVFRAGYLGFSIDAEFEGQGLMHEALAGSLDFVRDKYGLHRVMANHLVNNEKSFMLLKKLGFEQEGYAKSYLKINGSWQDHVLNSFVFTESE